MAVGGYTSAILTQKFGFSFWVALPLAGIFTGFYGLIGGAPSMRIKGFYLAVATIAIHFVTMWLLLHLEITGKSMGITVDPPQLGGFEFDTDERMFYIIMPLLFVLTYAARNLVRTRVGRALVAVRDNDLAAQVMGVNIFYYKLLAFFISCFYAGIAGSLWAHLTLVCHPEQFTLLNALWFIGMLIVGGGTILGVFFGVIFVRVLDELVLITSPYIADLVSLARFRTGGRSRNNGVRRCPGLVSDSGAAGTVAPLGNHEGVSPVLSLFLLRWGAVILEVLIVIRTCALNRESDHSDLCCNIF